MAHLPYRLIRSSRKTVSLRLLPDGGLVVRAPKRMPLSAIDTFVESKRGWVEKHLACLPPEEPKLTQEALEQLRHLAKQRLPALVARFAPLVGVRFGSVTIRAQHSRWGSCSGKGNLNFNCLLMLLPEPVQEYVVVHELCHRLEMNHSPGFWAEVERVLPDYRQRRHTLREQGAGLIRRLPE